MLSLIADLKAERDELKRDVDGWRTRVANLEDKVGILTKRVESERREAWVARSRLGLLELEKSGVEVSLEEKTASFQETLGKLEAVTREFDILEAYNVELQEQGKRSQEAEEECTRLRAALEEERRKRESLEKALDGVDLLATPTPETASFKRQMFRSVDSDASLTDVEPLDDPYAKAVTLKAVVEEDEGANVSDGEDDWDEENGLAGYEDEEDSDLSFQSPGTSSVVSMDEYTRAHLNLGTPNTFSLIASDASSNSVSPIPTLISKHAAHNSLSKTWTFPSGRQPTPSSRDEHEKVDRFFGCLDDLDTSPTIDFMSKAANNKSLFSQGFGADLGNDDEMPPFVLPSHVGVEVDIHPTLGVVLEEEGEEEEVVDVERVDEDFDGEEYEGGIRFTFNTPGAPIVSVSSPSETEAPLWPQAPAAKPAAVFVPLDEEGEAAEAPFTFPKPKSQHSISSSSSMDSFDSEMSFSARNFSPSSIPRSKALKSFTSVAPRTSSTPPKTFFTRVVTPPKRGGMMLSMIPQPVTSPLKTSAPVKPKAAPMLMCQPRRKAVPTANLPSARVNGSSIKPQPKSTRRPNLSSPRIFHSQRCDEHSL